jgi:DNA-binding IclR family transcriptional regulator
MTAAAPSSDPVTTSPDAATPDYSVPALDKALDILELLSSEAGGLTQSQVADAVGRSTSQIFRVLATLERRGYLYRDRQSGLYSLSTRMFDLAHRHPPLRGLVQLAVGPMRDLAEKIAQSCNLSVLDADRVRVIAQVESPADFGYRVRVGATFPLLATASGAVLLAGAPSDVRARFPGAEFPDIAAAGYFSRPDPLQAGITDVVVAIVDAAGTTTAALTVPYVATTFSTVSVDAVIEAALDTARTIAGRLRGMAS